MKRINIILMVMGLAAFALMIIGCGEEGEREVLDAGHIAYDPNGSINTQDQTTQVSFAATHEFTGTISEINEAKYSIITPSDYSGVRTQVPQMTLKIKRKDDTWIERAELVVTGADDKGSFSYRASCSEGANKNCGSYSSITNILHITLYDSAGTIELHTTQSNVAQHTLSGGVVVDGDIQQKLGKFDLVVKEVSNETK